MCGTGDSKQSTQGASLSPLEELFQFWKVLSSYVVASERGEGRRVDLIGCGLEEAPEEAAALLKVSTHVALACNTWYLP